MVNESERVFADDFLRFTEQPPYPWQKKLFQRFIAPTTEPWPEVVDLPTGAGKTSVLYVWLLALAWSIRTGTFGVPRRLAWIVNRRVVVDQITSEVETLLGVFETKHPDLHKLLSSISATGKALVASTLRGELADNGDWSRDPSTPAIIIGTVDMIGSRLLFRGYRAGRYHRPIHAGLLAVDTLIVNDEAHLSPALAKLLTAVRDLEPARQIQGKSFRMLLLSATQGSVAGLRKFDHEPSEDAANSQRFSMLFHAPKALCLREVTNLNELDAAMWKLATDSPAVRTAIFIEQPEKAAKFAERLRKEKGRDACALLTGTMRGFERDRLLEDGSFKRFLGSDRGNEPVWLVCTSAGEVGINFSCERMITGLEVEADHLLQRFGRLNRFGDTNPGEAWVVYRNPSDKQIRLRETLAYLQSLKGDVSCANIWENRPRAEACAERPALARLDSRHLDVWAQTTYKDRLVPPVASWLQGKQDSDEPDAEVAWRSDVSDLADWDIDPEQIRRILEYYPVRAREKLSEPASRVAKKLAEIHERVGPHIASQTKLIIVESDGTPAVMDLAHLYERIEKDRAFLHYKMLLLSDKFGSVSKGMFHSAASEADTETLDVADAVSSDLSYDRIRFRIVDGNAEQFPTTEKASELTPPRSEDRYDLKKFSADKYRPALVIPHSEKETRFLVYFAARSNRTGIAVDVGLSTHQRNVASAARNLAESLGLPGLAATYETVGNIHDNGKDRHIWQYAMGNQAGALPLAKTVSPLNPRLINGYRHELGSLLDSLRAGESDDLLLHLIASHHAAARPFFDGRQYDPTDIKGSTQECAEIARRYSRLQIQYGPWGLAYLEAVFKCADGIVSRLEGEPASD